VGLRYGQEEEGMHDAVERAETDDLTLVVIATQRS
jgi:hypothetical protein